MKMHSLLALTLLSVLFLGACATGGLTGDTYTREDARKVQEVKFGNVIAVRPVVIEGDREGIVGNLGGGVIGGIVGSSVGDGSGRALATVIGAIAGGIIGAILLLLVLICCCLFFFWRRSNKKKFR